MSGTKDWARRLTEALRSSDEQKWKAVREFLRGEGIDPNGTVIADLFGDDVNQEFVVLVSRDGRVFTFDFVSPLPGWPKRARDKGVVVGHWSERSSAEERFPYEQAIQTGLELL